MTGQRFTAEDYDALPEVLTADQVALVLSCTPVQARRWAAQGVIPGRQIGTRWRFSKSQIEALIREGTSPGESVESEDETTED